MMFKATDKPRVFGMRCGADFGEALANGLLERLEGRPVEDLARVEIYLNTRRMQRRVRDVFLNGPARLLPRLRLVTDLATDPIAADVAQPVSKLRRRLELSQLVSGLLHLNPDLAPRSALYDLSDSLAQLMDEMHGEGVDPSAVMDLDVSDRSGHWARTQEFIGIVSQFFDRTQDQPDTEARQRMVVERLIARWQETPPDHPVIIAGSTGSRGATGMLMEAVARLPQGAIVLPGVDYDMPTGVWDRMTDRRRYEDHPQFRFKLLMDRLGISIEDLPQWDAAPAPAPERNAVVSLSLRPAPVTDQWLSDGQALGDLVKAMAHVTLLEAPSPRAEAESIALGLRCAIDQGLTAALITPDRMLTRQVAAALDRWKIVPDDSAGQPLHLSAPGRFLRHVAGLRVERITGEMLLSLLKHPLTATGSRRGDHLRFTHELELDIRRNGPAYPDRASMMKWAKKDEAQIAWADWISGILDDIQRGPRPDVECPLTDLVQWHMACAERLASGPEGGESELWKESAGRKAAEIMGDFQRQSDAGGAISARDYAAMSAAILSGAEVRNPDAGHPQVLFWGTLEARVQSADLVILGGMNDGSWPETPKPDPWLNRDMREKAGLLLPERRIGLSAHDYQQAVAAKEVWITRAIRSEEAETVPSRWVNRLTNLLDGLPDQGGRAALAAMRQKGAEWIAKAASITSVERNGISAHRPSPRPPVEARPKDLSVTQIQTLIRDPYAIYARKVLDLKPLDPLVPTADAPLRGDIVHKVLELFIKEDHDPATPAARQRLLRLTEEQMERLCPWPAVRRLWIARMENAVDWFLATEVTRRTRGTPAYFEAWGELTLDGMDFTIKGKADRIDTTEDGRVILYDYKTGTPPSDKQQLLFDKQLILEAAMVARGAFAAVGKKDALDAEFLQIKDEGKITRALIQTEASTPKKGKNAVEDLDLEEEWEKFRMLIKAWSDPTRGYTAMMAAETAAYGGDFDHLSRYGEWNLSQDAVAEDVSR